MDWRLGGGRGRWVGGWLSERMVGPLFSSVSFLDLPTIFLSALRAGVVERGNAPAKRGKTIPSVEIASGQCFRA